MGKYLDLDDVASGHPVAVEELASLRLARDRYETARRMNPRQWADAWKLNTTTGKPFDEIIDDMRQFMVPNVLELSDTPKGRKPGAKRAVFALTRR
jgi:hypothetical protein